MLDRIARDSCMAAAHGATLAGAIMCSASGDVVVREGAGWLLCIPFGGPQIVDTTVGDTDESPTPFVAGTFGLLAPGQCYRSVSPSVGQSTFAVFATSIDSIPGLRTSMQGFHHDPALGTILAALCLDRALAGNGNQNDYVDALRYLENWATAALASLADEGESVATDIRMFVRARLSQAVSIRAMASHFGFSEGHFSRWCRGKSGQTPHQLVLSARFERAQLLLVETDWPLAQIAIESGYYDQSHFTHCFRRVSGMSPASYRRTQCQNSRVCDIGRLKAQQAPSSIDSQIGLSYQKHTLEY